jgi:hypothetical protein
VIERLAGFDINHSQAYLCIQQKYGTGITHKELLSVGQMAALLGGVPEPDRGAERDMRVLYKWFAENWSHVGSCLSAINLRDEHGEIISLQREARERH